MNKPSGAFWAKDGELRCRVCGRQVESNNTTIWCPGTGYTNHFMEEKPE